MKILRCYICPQSQFYIIRTIHLQLISWSDSIRKLWSYAKVILNSYLIKSEMRWEEYERRTQNQVSDKLISYHIFKVVTYFLTQKLHGCSFKYKKSGVALTQLCLKLHNSREIFYYQHYIHI